MESIKLSTSSFLLAMQKVKPAILNDSVLASLEMALISTEENRVRVTGYNLEMSITALISAECLPGCQFLIDIKKISAICTSMPLSDMTLEYDKVNDALRIECGNSSFELTGCNPDEYPILPDVGEVLVSKDMDGDIVNDCLNAISFASKDPFLPSITGVYFDFTDNCLKIVSTDGRALYLSDAYTGLCNKSFIIPSGCLKTICGIAKKENGIVSFTDTHCVYETRDIVMVVRLIDARFPDYKAIIPKYQSYFSVNKKELQISLKSMLPFANQITQQVSFEVGDKLKIVAEDIDFNTTSSRQIDLRFSNAKNIQCAFNGKLLNNVISAINTSHLKFYTDGDSGRGFVLKGSDSNAMVLVMPLMVA